MSLIRYEALINDQWKEIDENQLFTLSEDKEGFHASCMLELYLKAYTEQGKVPLKSNVIFQ